MENLIYALELVGTAVFAISGALAVSKAKMDIFGFSFLALMPAVGGGTLRNTLLGCFPVFWINDTNVLLVALIAAVLVLFLADRPRHRRELLVWMNAIGLALFAVLGTEVALQLGTNSLIAIVMGVITAVTGGIIRDINCNDIPLVLSKEIYATAVSLPFIHPSVTDFARFRF